MAFQNRGYSLKLSMGFRTAAFMISGFIGSLILVLPFYAWMQGYHWPLVRGFPLGWLEAGLSYMLIFFHEIGHTVFAWFYGYPAFPSFDFQHGGGMSYFFADQEMGVVFVVWALLAYGIYNFRDSKIMIAVCAGLLVFNIATVFNEGLYMSLIDFMGAGTESLVASFFLFRALFDLAPRGALERFMNSLLGFGMLFHTMMENWALLKNEAFRQIYFEQKGGHGFGDFDKIAERFFSIDFNDVVWWALALNFLCLVLPFALYGFMKFQSRV